MNRNSRWPWPIGHAEFYPLPQIRDGNAFDSRYARATQANTDQEKRTMQPFNPKPRKDTEDRRILSWSDTDRQRAASFTHSDEWRVLRILGELVEGFDTLAEIGPAVSIFGSARITEDDPMYQQARELGTELARAGITVITGGGPGIMEASNQGAAEGHGVSVGAGIELPFETGLNPYVTVPLEFRYFFVRKIMFVKYAQGFVFFPGGFGTLDELFEICTLTQTGKLDNLPIILFGTSYWSGLLSWIETVLVETGKVSVRDRDLFILTDSISEAARLLSESMMSAPT